MIHSVTLNIITLQAPVKLITPHAWVSFSKYFKYGESSKPSRTTSVNYQNWRTTPALLCHFLTLFLRKTELFTLHQHFQTLSLCNRHNIRIRNTTDLFVTQSAMAFSLHSKCGRAEVCRVANIESTCRMRVMKSVVTVMRFNTLA